MLHSVCVLSSAGEVGVVIVWAKWIDIELFSTQVLWPMTGVSLTVVWTWESQLGSVWRRVPSLVFCSLCVRSNSSSCLPVMCPRERVVSSGIVFGM